MISKMRYQQFVIALTVIVGWTSLFGQESPEPADAKPTRNLFQPTAGVAKADTAALADPEAVLSRVVQMDHNLLTSVEPSETINLNVFDNLNLVGVVDRINKRGANRVTVSGRLDGEDHSSFTIVLEEDAAVGIIRPELGGALYQIRYLGDGTNLISLIDPSLYPPEQCFEGRPQMSAGNESQLQEEDVLAPDLGQADVVMGACQPPETVWDILIPYTSPARMAMGGTNAAVAQCQLAVRQANKCYANSQIPARLRLVHCYEVSYNEPTNDMNDWLDWVTDSEAVKAVRNAYHADFVCMLVAGGTGLGWCSSHESNAHSVAQFSRAVNTWTLAHEVGHNMGCDHNRENAGDGCASYSFSYGWHYFGSSGEQWGTVMSYVGTRIRYFSNPNISYDSQPTGVPVGYANQANNAQTIFLRQDVCEIFRTTRYDIWVDFSVPPAAYQLGTFGDPYGTLAQGVSQISVPGTGSTELPVLWVKAGTTSETITINKPMVIRPCGGSLTIGR